VTGDWRRLYTEELHNLYTSEKCSCVIKSKRVGWVGHVERMGEIINIYKILFGKPGGKRQLKELGVDGKIILEWF
jgi:hypothetical protein